MENDLITGIIKKLREVVTDDVKIYIDEVKQDFKEPCFFIHVLNVTQAGKLNNRYYREYLLDVEYHPKDKPNVIRELAEVGEALLLQLEIVSIGTDPVRGKNIRYEVQDGVLHFFVTYPVFVFRVLDKVPYMETLMQKQRVKGDKKNGR